MNTFDTFFFIEGIPTIKDSDVFVLCELFIDSIEAIADGHFGIMGLLGLFLFFGFDLNSGAYLKNYKRLLLHKHERKHTYLITCVVLELHCYLLLWACSHLLLNLHLLLQRNRWFIYDCPTIMKNHIYLHFSYWCWYWFSICEVSVHHLWIL